MKRILIIALFAALAVPAYVASAKTPAGKPDEGIAKVPAAFFEAWNKHDVSAMTASWADDATLINPVGRMASGKAAIQKLFTDEQTTVFKSSTATLGEFKVTRSLGPNMVFCDGEVTVDGAIGPDGAAIPAMKMHMVVILSRQGDHWLFSDARPYAFIPAGPPPAAEPAR